MFKLFKKHNPNLIIRGNGVAEVKDMKALILSDKGQKILKEIKKIRTQ